MLMSALAPTGLSQRYILGEALGRGGMGAVFRAHDRLTGESVALKRLSAPLETLDFSSRGQGSSALALANEFRLLSSLRHPNIIAVRDYGFDERGQPFYTMELLNAPQNILSFGAERSNAQKMALIVQVLEALTYLHRCRVLHRDLAPNNLLFADGRLCVVDFGLSTLRGQRVGLAGTLPYLAPELLSDGQPSEASDLYAVGVLAYELLSGFNPFKADTVTQLLENILHLMPDLSVLDVDFATRHLLERLLAKNPAERAQDAAAVIADYYAMSDAPLPQQTVEIRESFLQSARFIGREAELGQLIGALEQAERGQGALWLIGGESGVGKSRFVDELRTIALVRGMIVLRGQAISDGGTLYQAWQAILRELVLHCAPSALEASILKPFVPDLESLLGQPIKNPPDLEPKKVRERFFDTVEALFRRLARPALVILEDIHWSGRGSLQLLDRLSDLAQQLPLLLVATYREEERADLIELLPRAQRISLARLTPAQMASLTEAMIGTINNTAMLADLLQSETEGNALFMIEVLRELAQLAGHLDQIGVVTLPQRLFSGGIQTVLRRRLARLPEAARSLLTLAAIVGRQLDLALLRELGEQVASTLDFETWLDLCANRAILERVDDQWRFTHDKLRETLLASLAKAEFAALSRQVAQAIEQRYPDDSHHWEALAHHWANARHLVKEAHYKARAGAQAVQRYAYARAIPLLERALGLADQVGFSALQRARLERNLGRAQQDVAQREVHYQRALHLLGQPFPSKSVSRPLIGAFMRQILLHRTLPQRFYRSSARRAEYIEESALIYQDLSGEYWNTQRLTAGAYAVMRALNLAETLPAPTVVLARAYVGATIGMGTVLGLHSAARFYGRKALESARRVQDEDTLAYVLNGVGIAAYYRGEREAQALFLDSAKRYRAIGDTDTAAVAQINAALAAYHFGNWRLTLRCLATVDKRSPRLKFLQYRMCYYEAQALLNLGERQQALTRMAEVQLPDDSRLYDDDVEYSTGLALMILRALQQSDLATAVEWLRPALSYLESVRGDSDELISAILEVVAHLPASARATYLSELAPYLSALRRLVRTRWISRAEYYRLQGLWSWLSGDERAACAAWQKGIAFAKQYGLRTALWLLYKTHGAQSGDERLLTEAETLAAALRAEALNDRSDAQDMHDGGTA
jgi:hypothetical protein